jgi:hypothetical protein
MPAENCAHVVHTHMRLAVNSASDDFLMKCYCSLPETILLYLNKQKCRGRQIRENQIVCFIHTWLLLKFLPKVQLSKLLWLIGTIVCRNKICIFIGDPLHYAYSVRKKKEYYIRTKCKVETIWHGCELRLYIYRQLFMRISKTKCRRNMVSTVKDEINWQTGENYRLNIIYTALMTGQLWLSFVGSHKTFRLILVCHRNSEILSPFNNESRRRYILIV